MKGKALVKTTLAVGFTATAIMMEKNVPTNLACCYGLGASIVSYICLPTLADAIHAIPDAWRSTKNWCGNRWQNIKDAKNALIKAIHPDNPNQNVLLGTTSGYLTSQFLSDAVEPYVNNAIDMLPVQPATKAFIRHPKMIAKAAMTITGGLIGHALSDKNVGNTLQTTGRAIADSGNTTSAPNLSSSSKGSVSVSGLLEDGKKALGLGSKK